MKKLSLLLLTIFVSVMGWAQLNPYAYGLSSSWNNATKKLTVTYSLNSAAYNDGAGGDPDGVQIHLTDDKNDPKKYYIYGVPAANIGKGKQTFTIDLSSGLDRHGKTIPENKNLYVAITVQGNRKISKPYMYSPGNNANNEFKVYSPHGIAVDKDPNSPNFGNIYVNEGWQETKTGFNTGKAGMYVIDATFDKFNTTRYTGNYDFSQYVIENTYDGLARKGYQPWRVRVSDDGRIFVCSNDMHQRQATNAAGERDGVAVWEVDRNNFNNWTPILHGYRRFVSGQTGTNYTFSYKDVNGVEQFIGPICGMDVKGTGDDVTLLLYTVNQAGVWLNMNGFRAYEYNVKSKTLKPISAFNKGTYGYIFEQVTLRYGVDGSYWFGASRAEGSDGNNTNGKTKEPNLGHVKLDGATADYTNYNAEFYAGAGLINYKSTYNNETINGANHSWLIAGKDNNGNDNGLFDVFLVTSSADGGASVTRMDGNGGRPNWQGISVKNTGRNLNDFAIDYAENLYIAGNGGNGGRVCAFAMPYGGEKTTIAREQYAFKYQNPVPNILATDLTYTPYGNENKYEFSFNVNTKPELAQIRFYANEADMLANNGNYSFYYEFSDSERKQGRMSVIFDAVGGTIGDDKLLNDPNGNGLRNLPRGEYYWNVYVKTRESNVFAPIYTQPAVGASDFHRQHATVDNNPNNKGFGHIYVADHHNIAESNNRVHYVRAYTIGNATGNAQQDNQSNINDNTRYTTYWQVQSNNKVRYTRRPIVSPDGMVYIADEGANQKTAKPEWFKDPNTSTYGFVGAGLHVLDPSKQTNNANAVWEANFSNPHGTTGNQEVTTGAYFLYKDGGWKLYRTNTYEEYTIHPAGDGTDYNYQNARWNNNGYRVYSITSTANGLVHSGYNDNQTTKRAFGAGDAGGQFSIIATEYGVWMCQHREKTVAEAPLVDGKPSLPDNKENIVLSFFDHSGNRKFTSYTYDNGNLTQNNTSILQSTPGAGMAYQKRGGVEYLYLVNHAGNILEFKITGGATPALTHTQTYVTGNGTKGVKYGAISSMNFDYAGNLVVTAGATYGVTNGVRDHQELVIYTMPYPNQENARAIPASEMYRYIPERVADDFRELDLLLDYRIANNPTCYVDIYRPMLTDMLNTICLPFNINTKQLDATDYYNATLLKFSQAVVTNQNGEKILELLFTADEDSILEAGVPYLIQAKNPITGIVQLKQAVKFTETQGKTETQPFDAGNNSIDFIGIMSTQSISVDPSKPWPLILVDNNRLAEVQSSGNMRGFRAYFQLKNELAPGTKVGISARKPTPTNVITIDGKRVNIEKFLREGRVYIRVGDSLYTITGEKVE